MSGIPQSAKAALHEGRRIDAIKHVRAELGVDLKAAKQMVDEALKSDPVLQASYAEMQARSGNLALRWSFALICVGAALGYLWWSA
jgi:hypothetical protein